jgi:HAD superfamily hydrolase (TIGR01509 family)
LKTDEGGASDRPAAILDIDGTLVDTNYHHAVAWYRAFREHGFTLPLWQLHRHIGMGGDQLVEALVGEEAEREHGDAIRDAHDERYMALIEEVAPLEGARELIEDLRRSGHKVILASSANPDEVDHYLDLLDARDLVEGWTTAEDVEETKPEPDLVESALEKLGGGPAVLVGDTVWDCQAAGRAGVATIAVLTGGFSREELEEAGAEVVLDSIEELRRRLGETPLG